MLRKKDHHRGGGHKGKDHRSHHRGPKTFRRGRAIAFLEMMNLKRSTIKQQLEEPEFQSINQLLIGELKAMDMVINEFIQLFGMDESEESETPVKKDENTENSSSENKEKNEKGIDSDETN
ncbi:hypothetical protein CR203_12340 [Salipaludibacillus neizhouensis]|uniref:O-antigen polymerase n=1 Tax=Salipaludibacillus neizhouensis TaxID=885475 RepID=A0A3A9KHW7_9BACI|nr:hypothetical protein [Salipaludibacillus neizhouensis]RKL67285.1 hypothetical protein CR203_12340 [Salipaludibacillus neizhouensis]